MQGDWPLAFHNSSIVVDTPTSNSQTSEYFHPSSIISYLNNNRDVYASRDATQQSQASFFKLQDLTAPKVIGTLFLFVSIYYNDF